MVQISTLLSAAVAAAAFGRVGASPVKPGLDAFQGGVKGELARRAVVLSTLTNNGIKAIPDGQQAPLRKEIRQLQQDSPEGFNLYILALASLMAKPQDDLTSYFQIAGIHGRPFMAWDGVTGGNNNGGYCTHADILFLSWHRPYLALYEGALFAEVQKIANQFPEGSKDRAAAANWRMPYWDWLSNNFNVPDVVGIPQIQVTDPRRGRVTIDNPLFSYKYKFARGQQEVQFPDPPFNTVTQSSRLSNAQLNQRFANIGNNLRNRVYNLLTAYTDFASFSNKGTTTAVNGRLDSLESVHDVIHATVGGNTGEMAYVDYAAMDVMFWLHHTNIDRLFAMWQGIRGNTQGSYLTPSDNFVAQFGTYAIPAGTRENSRTGLSPFHKTDRNGDFYTSDDVKSTKVFGYVYPETDDFQKPAENFSAWVISQVNALYGAGSPAGVLTSVSSVTASMSSTRAGTTTSPTTMTTRTSSTTSVPIASPPVRDRVSTSPSVPSATRTPNPPNNGNGDNGRNDNNGRNGRQSCNELSWFDIIRGARFDCLRNWWEGVSNNDNHRRYDVSDIPETVSDATDFVGDAIDRVGDIVNKAIDSIPSIGDLVKHANSLINGGDQYIEYVAQVKTVNNALKGTYTVYFFLGDYDATKPATWGTERNLVGTHCAFSNLGGGHQYTGSGSVPLTAALMNQIVAGKVSNLGREAVVPFLQKNLRWEVATAGGNAVPTKDVQGLKVSIASSDVKLACVEGALPVWGNPKTEYDVTEGKAGGLEAGETMV
ncbi:Tyrosinase [Drechslerella dactyloides]|uniref:tyrosinase n=1 Tax=Drechslerella dactyloides TaxID=74499 RepID=A0AAD6IWI5_DREDA|nr:Tyrosinase [Drechslerella dactyloides]